MAEDIVLQKVKEYIILNDLLVTGDHLLLSLSAGKDSMMLLECVRLIMDQYSLKVGIFHLNHLLRGSESDGEEEFIKNQKIIPDAEIIIERYDFNKDTGKESLEERARNKRYQLLHETAEQRGYTKIATAHTATDNAETLLMRILQGTGIPGLRGITPKRGMIIRPLLCLSGVEIYRYLEEHGLQWMEDSSNRDDTFLRNHLRLNIVPLIANRFPEAENALNHLGRIANEHVALIEELIEKHYGKICRLKDEAIHIPLEAVSDMRVLRFILPVVVNRFFNGQYMTRKILEQICGRLSTRKTHLELYRNKNLIIRKSTTEGEPVIQLLRINEFHSQPMKEWEYRYYPDTDTQKTITIKETGVRLHLESCTMDYFMANRVNPDILFIDLKEDIKYIVLRNRRRGDVIRLEKGTKKIKDLFIDLKLDQGIKASILHIVIGGDIAAIMSGETEGKFDRVSMDYHVRRDSKKILAICKVDN